MYSRLQCVEEDCACSVSSDGVHMYDDQEFDCIRPRFDIIGIMQPRITADNEPLISLFTKFVTIGGRSMKLYQSWLPFTKVHNPPNIEIHPAQKHIFQRKSNDYFDTDNFDFNNGKNFCVMSSFIQKNTNNEILHLDQFALKALSFFKEKRDEISSFQAPAVLSIGPPKNIQHHHLIQLPSDSM